MNNVLDNRLDQVGQENLGDLKTSEFFQSDAPHDGQEQPPGLQVWPIVT